VVEIPLPRQGLHDALVWIYGLELRRALEAASLERLQRVLAQIDLLDAPEDRLEREDGRRCDIIEKEIEREMIDVSCSNRVRA
jgi:hypothetical protein